MAPKSPTSSTIKIEQSIRVKDLADLLGVGVAPLISKLIEAGIWATVNENIDFEAAAAAAKSFGVEVEAVAASTKTSMDTAAGDSKAVSRPPIIAVMGHVDHGKTSLLDAIAKTDVVSSEAGGITQHLSAYQIKRNNRLLTFIDTPGHEAFMVLREHGAYLTDVAVIVVAADDGVKPQTVEAIKFAQKAGVKTIVALNKVDKPDVDLNKVKQQLAEHGLNPEEWGGDTVMVEVSAKAGTGIDKLLDVLLLIVDIEDLKAPASGPATGSVIEAHIDKGKGPMATLLVASGQLQVGDALVVGSTHGKVRLLETTGGKQLKTAGPSTPVVVAGLKSLPKLGDDFKVAEDAKTARSESAQENVLPTSAPAAPTQVSQTKTLNLVLKTDVDGSLESISQNLQALNTPEVAIKLVAAAVGPINESDIHLAESGEAELIGFNVPVSVAIKQLAAAKSISLKIYKVIYELLDEVKAELDKLVEPEVVESTVGELEVKGVFRITQKQLICGGSVKSGLVQAGLLVRRLAEEETPQIGTINSVQKEQQDVKSVKAGQMCGLRIDTKAKVNLKIGEKLEFFKREMIKAKT